MPGDTPVQQFYRNKVEYNLLWTRWSTTSCVTCFPQVVFITGGTGFVGKVLLEKLLRSTDVRKVYLLIRAKRGHSAASRLETLLTSRLFETMRAQGKEPGPRVCAMHGDIDLPRLGLSDEDIRIFTSQVTARHGCNPGTRWKWSFTVPPPSDSTRSSARPSA